MKIVKKIKTVLLIIINSLIFSLLFLILIDYFLDQFLFKKSNFINEKDKIEINLRKENEELIKKAKQEGYNNYYVPEFYDERNGIFHEISKKYNYAPVGSKPYTKTFMCNEGYGLIKFKTDRYGLRNNDHKWNKQIDVFFIGDSFTAGACVKNEDTISSKYEALTGLNSINLASSGNSPFHYGALSNIFVPYFKPKKVILIFYANDNKQEQNQLYDLYVLKQNDYFKEIQNKNKINFFYQDIMNVENKILKKTSVKKILENNYYIYKIIKFIKYRSTLPTIREVFKLENKKIITTNIGSIKASGYAAINSINITNNHCKKIKCKVVVVYIPNSNYWRPTNTIKVNNFVNILKNYTESKSIDFLDISKILNVERDSPDYAIKGGHLSPAGYQKIANYLINY